MPKTESNSTTETDQPQTPQYVQYAPPYAQPFEDDTIDLYELWITLWSKRWLVIGVTAVAAIGSVVFALLAPQIYKAEALLLPPKAKDVQSLNVKGVPGASAAGVFSAFNKNLSSRSLQKKFIEKYDLLDILAPNRTPETRDIEILESFSKMMKIENKGGFSISMESNDPVFAAKLVNDYVGFFDLETVLQLVSDARNSIQEQIVDIEYKIASKRQMAKQRREDQILRFEEATVIARKLEIKDRVDTNTIVQNNQLNISTSNTPLYYRGFKALNAEIVFLNNRKSDDPFIAGLRDLQERLALLRSFKFSIKGMHSVHIDQAAYPPKHRIKPNRRLIVSLGTVVGLFLGIFLVFFVSFIQNQKEAHSA